MADHSGNAACFASFCHIATNPSAGVATHSVGKRTLQAESAFYRVCSDTGFCLKTERLQPSICHRYSQGTDKTSTKTQIRTNQIRITGRPGQPLVTCGNIRQSSGVTLLAGTAAEQVYLLTEPEATFRFRQHHPCPTGVSTRYPYHIQHLIRSDEPFLATITSPAAPDKQSKHRITPSLPGIPVNLSPEAGQLLAASGGFGDGGDGGDEDSSGYPRPPRPGLLQLQGSFMTLLPVIRLAQSWNDLLPGSLLDGLHWYHWLLGEPDQTSGIWLLIHGNQGSPVRLWLSQQEYRELAGKLTDTGQLLRWLAPRLSSRVAFIGQLLDIMATMNPAVSIDQETATIIEQQLASVLELEDHQFSLELELFTLKQNLISHPPDNRILQLPHQTSEKQQPYVSSANSDKTSSQKSTRSSSEGSDRRSWGNSGQSNGSDKGDHQKFAALDASGSYSEEQPYFTLVIGAERWEFRVAKSQLNPAKRGEDNPADIFAYQPKDPTDLKPLDTLEEIADVPKTKQFRATESLTYLLEYGTTKTKADLLEFYPLYELAFVEGNPPTLNRIRDISQLKEICTICLYSQINRSVVVRPDCGHYFHLKCLTEHCRHQREFSGEHGPASCTSCTVRLGAIDDILATPQKMEAILREAAARGEVMIVNAMLEADVDINTTDQQKNTALHRATQNGHSHVVSLLLEHNIDSEIKNKEQLTAMDLASMSGQSAIFHQLAKATNISPVGYWVKKGLNSEIQRWIDNGHSLTCDKETNNVPLLHIAAEHNQLTIATRLLNAAEASLEDIINEQDTRQRTALFPACEKDHRDMVELLLTRGAAVDIVDQEAETALILAARAGYTEVVALLLEHQASLNPPASECQPLIEAADNGHDKTVEVLFKKADHSALPDVVLHALKRAADNGYHQIVSWLLTHGFDQESLSRDVIILPLSSALVKGYSGIARVLLDRELLNPEDYQCALVGAVVNNQPEVAKLLLEKGASAEVIIKGQETALMHSVVQNFDEMVRTLLEHGAQVDRVRSGDKATALIFACDKDSKAGTQSVAIVKTLLGYGAKVNHQTTRHHLSMKVYTPISMALIRINKDIIDLLLENTAKPPFQSILSTYLPGYKLFRATQKGRVKKVKRILKKTGFARSDTGNALYYAALHGHMDIAKILIEKGADINYARLTEGDTPLHGASRNNHAGIVDLLLENDADPRQKNHRNEIPLDIASQKNHRDIVAKLSPSTLPVAPEGKGIFWDSGQALYQAASEGALKVVEYFMGKHANPNIKQDGSLNTPLHGAAENNHLPVVRLLLEQGAKYDLRNSEGLRPIEVARRKKHEEVETALIRATCGAPLLDAALAQDFHKMQLLLSQSEIVTDYCRADKKTPLHIVTEAGNTELVMLLLERSIRPDDFGNGLTPLHLAAIGGHIHIAQALVDNGADPRRFSNEPESHAQQPLHYASRNNQLTMIQWLVGQLQVNINQPARRTLSIGGDTSQGWTALHIAADARLPDMMSCLLEMGADPKITNQQGETPVQIALRQFDEKQLSRLISRHSGIIIEQLQADPSMQTLIQGRCDISWDIKEQIARWCSSTDDRSVALRGWLVIESGFLPETRF